MVQSHTHLLPGVTDKHRPNTQRNDGRLVPGISFPTDSGGLIESGGSLKRTCNGQGMRQNLARATFLQYPIPRGLLRIFTARLLSEARVKANQSKGSEPTSHFAATTVQYSPPLSLPALTQDNIAIIVQQARSLLQSLAIVLLVYPSHVTHHAFWRRYFWHPPFSSPGYSRRPRVVVPVGEKEGGEEGWIWFPDAGVVERR